MSFRLRTAFPILLAACGVTLAADQTAADQPAAKSKRSWPHVRIGGIMIGAGYSHFSGPFPYWGYGPYAYAPYGYFYDPFLYSSLIHPGFYTGFPYGPSMGQIKLPSRERDKDTWVYLDGALAGRADHLKTMWLEPGAYNLELRKGNRRQEQRIYVLSGKTLKITAEMLAREEHP
jgi:hypothetical protein